MSSFHFAFCIAACMVLICISAMFKTSCDFAFWTQYLSSPDLFVTLQIWSKNIKMKSVNLTALKKHGKVFEDGESSAVKISIYFVYRFLVAPVQMFFILCFASIEQFGCLVWSHSETHLLYVAERKRPKTESFFQVCQQNCIWGLMSTESHGAENCCTALYGLKISSMLLLLNVIARVVFNTVQSVANCC